MKRYKRRGDLIRWRYGGVEPAGVLVPIVLRGRFGAEFRASDGTRFRTTGRGWEWMA